MGEVFEYRFAPQFYDFDQLGIAHNVVYIRWLEDARCAFLNAGPWPMQRYWAADLSPALTGTEIHYHRAIRYGDSVLLRLHITRAGRSAWALAFSFNHPETGDVYASSGQTGCIVRPSTGRPTSMPTEFLDFCRRYLTGTADVPDAE